MAYAPYLSCFSVVQIALFGAIMIHNRATQGFQPQLNLYISLPDLYILKVKQKNI